MDTEVLLLNPRGRARRKSAKGRKRNPTRSPAQRAATRRMIAANRARQVNPAPRRTRAKYRRRNPATPVSVYRRRSSARRRNPIALGGILATVKQGAIQAGGAIVMDVAYAQIARFLPASMQAAPGALTMGSIVKLGLTAALGKALSRATRGMSQQAALGAITVQARDMILGALPPGLIPGMPSGSAVAGRMGYASPAAVVNWSPRVGPNGVGALTPGRSPLLSGNGPTLGLLTAGATPLLNGGVRSRNLRRVR